VRANIVRADCNAHLSEPESLVELLEDVWALISDRDNFVALGQGSINSLKVFFPVSICILVDEELSHDREGLLSVDIIGSLATRSISSISVLDTDSALALSGFRASA